MLSAQTSEFPTAIVRGSTEFRTFGHKFSKELQFMGIYSLPFKKLYNCKKLQGPGCALYCKQTAKARSLCVYQYGSPDDVNT